MRNTNVASVHGMKNGTLGTKPSSMICVIRVMPQMAVTKKRMVSVVTAGIDTPDSLTTRLGPAVTHFPQSVVDEFSLQEKNLPRNSNGE